MGVKDELSPRSSGVEGAVDTPLTSITSASESKARSPSITTQSGNNTKSPSDSNKRRRCVSTACIACRRRKSKCDGNLPCCSACTAVYHTQCVYDPSSDHRRKGVYKKDINGLKTRNETMQILIQAVLNEPLEDAFKIVKSMRACESLDKFADAIKENGVSVLEEEVLDSISPMTSNELDQPTFESQLSNKVGELRLDNGSVRMIGGTSNLLFLEQSLEGDTSAHPANHQPFSSSDVAASWTKVTSDPGLIRHLLNYYFCWHYEFFTIIPRAAFERDFNKGVQAFSHHGKTQYCSPILVNAMLALGCHFTSCPGAREDPEDSATAGDHFFKEAKRLIYEEDLLAAPRLSTVQALALLSVREAGCGREARGWVYSGMAFRMACDLGLSFSSSPSYTGQYAGDDEAEDAKRITFWGCFMIDKIWSNYLGRVPIFQKSNVTTPKFAVVPAEDAAFWCPYSESGYSQSNAQPSRVRAVALHISALCDISSDLIGNFYHPELFEKPLTKQAELKRLQDIHGRLEDWKRQLPGEFEPKEGTLPSVIIMHMLFQVLYIHLFRPFLKYNQNTSPLPNNISPRKLCTQAASHISKLLRLYKRSHGLRQIVNLAVYITHTACTIHLLNLPDKNACRDITHGVKALEEIAEGWLCARRTLSVLSAQARKWQIELPEEAAAVLARTDSKFGALGSPENQSPLQHKDSFMANAAAKAVEHQQQPQHIQEGRQENVNFKQPQAPIWSSAPAAVSVPSSQEMFGYGTSPTGMESMPSQYAGQQAWENQQAQQAMATQQALESLQQQQQSGVPSRKRRLPTGTEATSMFGGVEALLREGQDWWMKDQSQMASGFDNWNLPSSRRPSVMDQSMQQQSQQQQQMQNNPRRPSGPANNPSDNTTNTTQSGYPPTTDLGSTYGLFSPTYNESEWYR